MNRKLTVLLGAAALGLAASAASAATLDEVKAKGFLQPNGPETKAEAAKLTQTADTIHSVYLGDAMGIYTNSSVRPYQRSAALAGSAKPHLSLSHCLSLAKAIARTLVVKLAKTKLKEEELKEEAKELPR